MGGGGRGIGSKAEPGKKGGVGGRCVFKIWFCFSLSYSDLIGNKLISFFFPQVESVLPVTIIGE